MIADYIPELCSALGALVLTLFRKKIVRTAVMRAATAEDLK